MSEEPAFLLWIGELVMLCVPGYFVLQVWLAHAWRGGWRTAALVPLIFMAPAVLFSLFALSKGSNLWPITVVLLSPLAFTYLAIVWVSRTIAEAT